MYKYALTIGVFDMFHAGHKNLLKEMLKRATKNIIILHDDRSTFINKDKFPVQGVKQRKKNLLSTGLVSEVFITEEADPTKMVEYVLNFWGKDFIYVRGNDWVEFPAKQALENHKIPIEYVIYTEGVSSTKIRSTL